MTGKKYLKLMFALSEELGNAAGAEPYDPHAYNLVIDKINHLNHLWFVSLDQRRRIKNILCVAAIVFVLYLIYCLLSEGFGCL